MRFLAHWTLRRGILSSPEPLDEEGARLAAQALALERQAEAMLAAEFREKRECQRAAAQTQWARYRGRKVG